MELFQTATPPRLTYIILPCWRYPGVLSQPTPWKQHWNTDCECVWLHLGSRVNSATHLPGRRDSWKWEKRPSFYSQAALFEQESIRLQCPLSLRFRLLPLLLCASCPKIEPSATGWHPFSEVKNNNNEHTHTHTLTWLDRARKSM